MKSQIKFLQGGEQMDAQLPLLVLNILRRNIALLGAAEPPDQPAGGGAVPGPPGRYGYYKGLRQSLQSPSDLQKGGAGPAEMWYDERRKESEGC